MVKEELNDDLVEEMHDMDDDEQLLNQLEGSVGSEADVHEEVHDDEIQDDVTEDMNEEVEQDHDLNDDSNPGWTTEVITWVYITYITLHTFYTFKYGCLWK